MNQRNSRNAPSRSGAALIHRGPQAMTAPHTSYAARFTRRTPPSSSTSTTSRWGSAPTSERSFAASSSSDIIKGKVAVQRAYADWRRYPQYIVPLAESSIDLIFAPAYGSSKKNATDIRLAIDALELVFTRPEIGTFILLSGDSDFSSLVIKLKEYGKYVIGVGIRESSSDLLVQNCDEYYSYNALAGLVKSDEDEPAKKYDPWELVTEAVQRMKRNNDVMRSDRLKQVMQEIDSTFDEKNLGMSKFSRFCQEAAQRGLLSVTKLENGQLEVDLPSGAKGDARAAENAVRRRSRARRDAAAPLPRTKTLVAVAVAVVVAVVAIARSPAQRRADRAPLDGEVASTIDAAQRPRSSRRLPHASCRCRTGSCAGRAYTAPRSSRAPGAHAAPEQPSRRTAEQSDSPASASRATKRSISCVARSPTSRRATQRFARATFVEGA